RQAAGRSLGVATPAGKPCWNVASVRGILRNPAYAGRAQTNRTRVVPARQRRFALRPVGPGESHAPRPPEEWIEVPVPPIVSEETFAQVQAKLDTNQQGAARAGWGAPAGRPRQATATTCAVGTPTRCAHPQGNAAGPATSPPGSSTSW